MTVDALDLCTLAQVRTVLQKATAATSQDALIQDCITAGSIAIMELTGREFVSDRSGSTAVTFRYDGGGVLNFDWRCDLRGSPTAVTINDGGVSPTSTTLTADDYRFISQNPRGGVHTCLELRGQAPAGRSSAVDYTPSMQVVVTGTWGFAAVPSEVKRAAVMTAAHWVRQMSFWGAGFDPSAGDLTDGRYAIPGMALSLLRPWMRVSV